MDVLRRATGAALLLLAACASPPVPNLRPGCRALANQWEQTSYAVDASALVTTRTGIAVDLSRLDAVADGVDACLGEVDRSTVAPAAACAAHAPWRVERGCTTVVLVPGEESCTRPGTWLLPDSAGTACDTWSKPTTGPDGGDCSWARCRPAVATQDGGRTVVLPTDPDGRWDVQRAAEGFVRVATSCAYPWSDPALARCSQGT